MLRKLGEVLALLSIKITPVHAAAVALGESCMGQLNTCGSLADFGPGLDSILQAMYTHLTLACTADAANDYALAKAYPGEISAQR